MSTATCWGSRRRPEVQMDSNNHQRGEAMSSPKRKERSEEKGAAEFRYTVETIQEVSRRITQRVRRPREWRESDKLKQLRTQARTGPMAQRRDAWKRVWKLRKLERRHCNEELCSRALLDKGLDCVENLWASPGQSMAIGAVGG